MNDDLKLLEIFRKPRPDDVELARCVVSHTGGWPVERIEAAFDVALDAGLLSRADAEALRAQLDSLGTLESLPELAQVQADAHLLEQQRARLRAEHDKVFPLQSKVYEMEGEQRRNRDLNRSLTEEIARLEHEMRRLDELIGEVNP